MAFSVHKLDGRTVKIVGALVVAVVFVIAGYSLPILLTSSTANAESTQAALRADATKDTDNDGLPDWQEELYGANPNNPRSIDPNLTDKEAVDKGLVQPKFASATTTPESAPRIDPKDLPGPTAAPGSLTDDFAKTFFQTYINGTDGQTLTTGNTDAIVSSLTDQFGNQFAQRIHSSYSLSSVRASVSVDAASYAASIEAIFTRIHPAAGSDLGTLVNAYIVNGDASARPKLAALAGVYAKIAVALAAVPVPPALANAHLTLLTSYDLVAQATATLANYTSDPLAAIGVLSIYTSTETDIPAALQQVENAVVAENGTPGPGEPGSLIAKMLATPAP